jgi:DNA-binding NtrC family response regulator
MAVPRLLIVSEDGSSSVAMSRTLGSLGYQVFVADDEAGALDLFKTNFYAMVIVDLQNESNAGFEFMRRLRQQQENMTCILLADPPAALDQDAASQQGIRRVLEKPVDLDDLIDAVEEVLCSDSLKFDQKYSDAAGAEAVDGQMVRGDRPVWCEVCGYSTHWHHKGLMRHFCSDTCLEQYQRSSGVE